jgi:hypothetical protein
MRITIATAAIAAALALAACNSPTIPPGNYGTIAGTITANSGQPIAGVTVQVDYSLPSNVTGPDGKYIVSSVPITTAGAPAHVEVSSVPNGYRKPPPRDDVQVQAGQITQNVNFVLQPG